MTARKGATASARDQGAPGPRGARRRHKPVTFWARQLIRLVHHWLPPRSLVVVGDRGYAALDLLDAVETRRDSSPVAFTWRGTRYRVRMIGHWKLATRWWESDRHSDRTYYRVETAGHQIFELYCDDAQDGCWVLDICQD